MYPTGFGTMYVRPPSGATAIIAAVLALLGGSFALLGLLTFLAFVADVGFENAVRFSGAFSPDWWEIVVVGGHICNAVTAVLLLVGAVQLLRRRLAGRTMIILGCLIVIAAYLVGWAVAESIAGSWRDTYGDYGDDFSSELDSIIDQARLSAAGISLVMLIFPVATLFFAAAPATRRWCLFRAVPLVAGSPPYMVFGPHGPTMVVAPPPTSFDPTVINRPPPVEPTVVNRPPPANPTVVNRPPTDPTMVNPGTYPRPFVAPVTRPPRIPVATLLGDISTADRIRDAVAVGLLLTALLLRWNRNVTLPGDEGPASVRALIVFTTLPVLIALAMPYLSRIGAFGPDWSSARIQAVQLLAAGPYLLLVAGFVLADVFSAADLFDDYAQPSLGTGPAVWAGAAAVMLALRPPTDNSRHYVWTFLARPAMWITASLALLSGVVAITALALGTGIDPGARPAAEAAVIALATMLAAGVAAIAASGLRADFPAWQLTVIAYGTALLAVGAFGSLVGRGVEHFGSAGYCASLGWCVAASLAAGAGPSTADAATHTGYVWLAACRNALILLAFQASFDGVATVSTAVADSLPIVGTTAATVCAGLIVIAAVTGAQAIRPSAQPDHDPRPHRAITVTACGVIALASALRPIVGPEVDVEVTSDAVVPLLALIVAAVLLTARPITDLYGQPPLFADVSSALRPSTAVTAAPIRADEDRLSVADPHTSEAVLARIARRRPDLRAAVAAHPNTRQGLLDWLAAQGDPEVTQAIVARREG